MIRPGDSRTLNRLASDVSRLDADLVRGRNAYPDDNKPFMAYISGNLAGAHSWYKLVSMDDGDNDQDGWGLEGTVSGSGNVLPAYALDGSTVATGSVVLMWFADVGSEMRFVPPPSAGGGLDLSGRSGSIADVTALQILRGVISGTAGAAVFTPDDASASLPGIVSTGVQEFAGAKTLTNVQLLGQQFFRENSGSGYELSGSFSEGGTYYLAILESETKTGNFVFLNDEFGPDFGTNAGGDGIFITGQICAQGFSIMGYGSAGAGVYANRLVGQSFTDAFGNIFYGGIAIAQGSANATIAGSIALTGDISPSQLTADTNDWSPTGWN